HDALPILSNLLAIYASCTGESIATLEEKYSGKGYGEFKADVAEIVVRLLEPSQKRYAELIESAELDDILDRGAEKASTVANKTLRKVNKAIELSRVRK